MTRTITLTKRENTHTRDLRLLIEREKEEILKLLFPVISVKTGKSYDELKKKYIIHKK